MVVDTTQRNSLYQGYPGIGVTGWNLYKYFDLYYHEKKKEPYLDIPRDYKGKQYIIFQWRESLLGAGKHRLTQASEFKYLYDTISKHFGEKYEYWKMGEPCQYDELFDKVIPIEYNSLDNFVRNIRNSSLIVGAHSGPPAMAFYFEDVPIIRYGMFPQGDPMDKQEWRKRIGYDDKRVEFHPTWGLDKLLWFNKGDLPSKEKIIEFLEKHNI